MVSILILSCVIVRQQRILFIYAKKTNGSKDKKPAKPLNQP